MNRVRDKQMDKIRKEKVRTKRCDEEIFFVIFESGCSFPEKAITRLSMSLESVLTKYFFATRFTLSKS